MNHSFARRGHGRREDGFAMLFAVLTSSVLLSIGLSIFNLTIKEIALSGSGRDSQSAFYAADSGVECAIYWDVIATDVFATSTDDSYNPDSLGPSCAGQPINLVPDASRTLSSASTRFSFAPTDASNPNGGVCTLVDILKDSQSGSMVTKITSRGYNVGYYDSDVSDVNIPADHNLCAGIDKLKVERALLITY